MPDERQEPECGVDPFAEAEPLAAIRWGFKRAADEKDYRLGLGQSVAETLRRSREGKES